MPRAYSGDLRRRVVAAVLDGGQSREVVARRFAVGRSTVYRWIDVAQSEGRLEAKPMCGGPKPTIRDDGEAALRKLVADDNHLSLAEYRDRLAEATGVRVHPWTLGRALRRPGLTRKKAKPARRRAGRGRGAASAGGVAQRGGRHPGRASGLPRRERCLDQPEPPSWLEPARRAPWGWCPAGRGSGSPSWARSGAKASWVP
jgi:transposase